MATYLPASQAGPEAAAGTTKPPAPPIPVYLGLSKHSYVQRPALVPNSDRPIYSAPFIDEPILVNSPNIDQLIHENKLE